MGLGDRLKDLTKKAEETAAGHKDQIREVVQKAGVAADERTGGQFHEQIQKAGAKARSFVDGLNESSTKGEPEMVEPSTEPQNPTA